MVTIQRQTRLVMIAAAVVCAVYFPTAYIVGKSYAPRPVPPGAVKGLFEFERLSVNGFAFLCRQPNFSVRPEFVIYENDKPLPGPGNATMREIDGSGLGRYSQENGKGFRHLGQRQQQSPRQWQGLLDCDPVTAPLERPAHQRRGARMEQSARYRGWARERDRATAASLCWN